MSFFPNINYHAYVVKLFKYNTLIINFLFLPFLGVKGLGKGGGGIEGVLTLFILYFCFLALILNFTYANQQCSRHYFDLDFLTLFGFSQFSSFLVMEQVVPPFFCSLSGLYLYEYQVQIYPSRFLRLQIQSIIFLFAFMMMHYFYSLHVHA